MTIDIKTISQEDFTKILFGGDTKEKFGELVEALPLEGQGVIAAVTGESIDAAELAIMELVAKCDPKEISPLDWALAMRNTLAHMQAAMYDMLTRTREEKEEHMKEIMEEMVKAGIDVEALLSGDTSSITEALTPKKSLKERLTEAAGDPEALAAILDEIEGLTEQ